MLFLIFSSLLNWIEWVAKSTSSVVDKAKRYSYEGFNIAYNAVVPRAAREQIDGVLIASPVLGYVLILTVGAFLLHPEGIFIEFVGGTKNAICSFRNGSWAREILVFMLPLEAFGM